MGSLYPEADKDNKPDQVIHLEMSPEDKADVKRDADGFKSLEDISKIAARALDVIESTYVRSLAEIKISKIGIVPDQVPDGRFPAMPEDITKGDLFASGHMRAPIPVCELSETDAEKHNWMLLDLGFSFYRRGMGKPKIIFSIYPYTQSSDYLKPVNERVSERQKGFEKLRRGIYHRKIPTETFNGLKEKFEPIFERWLREYVQSMMDRGEFSKMVEAVEKDRKLLLNSDVQIDPSATEGSMDRQLGENLRKPSPIKIPSSQSYVGEDAELGWLALCRAPSYGLASRELDFLTEYGDKISEAVGPVEHVMMFGLGDADKEEFLIKKLLESRNENDKPLDVHGIDVGLRFHLNALKAMKKIREETGKKVGYRGHVSLFESAEEISAAMRKPAEGEDRTLRFSLGNTFCNFDDPWSVFAKGMKAGDKLMITSDIVPSAEGLDTGDLRAREEKINQIVARYQIPEWKEWVLNPLYRAGFRGRVHSNNVEVRWDEVSSAVVFHYKFNHPVDNGNGVQFGPGDEIRLYMSKKIDPLRFAREAGRNGLSIKELLKNESGELGCFILEKGDKT